MTSFQRSPLSRALVLAVAGLFLAASLAEARPGRGGGFGSRGARTWSAPPPTPTAPRQAAPIERSTQAPGPTAQQRAQQPAAQAPRPTSVAPSRGGFLGGLVGAGLIGLLLGYGFAGGLGGLASVLGLLFQVALILLLVTLAFRFFQRRAQPAYAGAGAPGTVLHRGPSPARAAPAGASRRDAVGITQADLDAFERLLGAVQEAYGTQDVAALRRLATPEAASFLAEELADGASRGVVNRVADVKLLQGDLAEAWREGEVEYATVAMRFSLRDWTVESATGRVLEGDPERPVEATEVWTFRRARGGDWLLAAIQRA